VHSTRSYQWELAAFAGNVTYVNLANASSAVFSLQQCCGSVNIFIYIFFYQPGIHLSRNTDPDPGGQLITDPKKTTEKILFTYSMEEPGEQCIVVFALFETI
jgi:hypothetical protein